MSNSLISGSSRGHRIPQELLKETNFSNTNTWKLALWFELNAHVKRIVRKTSYYIGATEIERWCHDLWASGMTPEGIELKQVDWNELDRLWSTQSKKLFDETQKMLDYRVFKEWNEC
jgi:hypothetical protein